MPSKKTKTFTVEIDIDLCKGCERCVRACPKKLLRRDDKINAMGYPIAIYAGEGCIGCGACFYGCPEAAAITVFEETSDEAE
jgi:ferredoxin